MKCQAAQVALLCVLALAPCSYSQEKPIRKDAELPKAFDLRKVDGITPVKKQSGGTCWTHGTMAAIESNLLVSGAWKKLGGADFPCLSEYHLDWWNGFNQHKNDDRQDPKDPGGLKVHVGGDYRVAAAYLSRGDGVVSAPRNPDGTVDTGWYSKTPDQRNPQSQRFFVRDVEWFVIGPKLENIDAVKRRIMTHGAIGTAYAASKTLLSKDFVHYQPPEHAGKPNHAVAIVGWDDDKLSADPTKPLPKPGCWLIKNSWGTKKGDQGYYWISYHDKVCCRDPEMGAVSFRNVEPMKFGHIYLHDYHGWRDTMKEVTRALNVFAATDNHKLASVSFYTAADDVRYTASIYSRFDGGELQGLRATRSGTIERSGLHTIDLGAPVSVTKGERFVVYLELSAGGHAIDRTSKIPVLLSQPAPKQPDPKQPATEPEGTKKPRTPTGPVIVVSRASPGESYYFDGKAWRDLYDYRFENPPWATFDHTANFCMKALAVPTR
jgi:C1A family cysteine protease